MCNLLGLESLDHGKRDGNSLNRQIGTGCKMADRIARQIVETEQSMADQAAKFQGDNNFVSL